jgi:hypothetical protein
LVGISPFKGEDFKFLCRWMTVKEAGMGLPAKVGHRTFADWLGTAHQQVSNIGVRLFLLIRLPSRALKFPPRLKFLICF